MNNQVQQIRAKIKERIDINETCQKISGGNEFYRGAIDEGKELLSFIDSLQNEHVDYNKLKTMLDDALSKETKESWNEWLDKEEAEARIQK